MTGPYVDGVPAPEFGPGMVVRVCRECPASWVGLPDEPCGWCADRHARMVDEERRLLLYPPWLRSDAGAGALRAWAERLARAVQAGIITHAEARRALERVQSRRLRRAR